LFNRFDAKIQSLTLIPSGGGRFEVQLNDQLIFSKLQTERHPEPSEITGLVEKILKG
jgi:selenoprotein W-related protein